MRPGNTIVVIRSVIAAVFVALAVANFVGGRVIFGVLFAALAVMNVAMTSTSGDGGRSSTAASRAPCCRTS
jgi:hypothetical protein